MKRATGIEEASDSESGSGSGEPSDSESAVVQERPEVPSHLQIESLKTSYRQFL